MTENEKAATAEVVAWAQAVLTALNVGDVKSGSLLHLKLREIMIAYRDSKSDAPNDRDNRPARKEICLMKNQ